MLDKHLYKLRDKFATVKLKCRDSEFLNPTFLYQENFPFWCQPYSTKTVDDYKVGDRVINVNSTKREYVPFGLRGTVVGHTNDRVIILFDE
jgi:Xrn1 SH3-like domain